VSELSALAGAPDFASGGVAALFLHGYGSHERDLVSLARWLPEGLGWASLRAPIELPHGGSAWFPILTPGNPDPEPVAVATEAIWSWLDEHAPATTIVPIGFSQGGLMATELLRTRPDQVLATVVLGGFVQAATRPGDAMLADRRPPVFWGRGADDHVITPEAVQRTSRWLPTHSALTEHVYPGLGHGIDAAEMEDVRGFLTEHLRTAAARRAPGHYDGRES
jgi:phospholipase/carboxylesterase